jgi:hypothetical protein
MSVGRKSGRLRAALFSWFLPQVSAKAARELGHRAESRAGLRDIRIGFELWKKLSRGYLGSILRKLMNVRQI